MPERMRWKRGHERPESGKTVRQLADHILSFFTRLKRDNGDEVWVTKREAPEWIRDEVLFPAHADMPPDDVKYEFIFEALSRITEIDNLDEPELEADVYNNDLLSWLASHLERAGYVDEAVRDYGHSQDMGIMGDIMMGQLREKEEVYFIVLERLRRHATEGD